MNELRVLRAQRRVSQMRVATAAGLGTTRYWKIENGFAEPTAAERHAIAKALGVTVRRAWRNRRQPVVEHGAVLCAG